MRGRRAERQRLLLDACVRASEPVGAYDAKVIEWLAGQPPAVCAVIAGLIRRAHDAGSDGLIN
jgi:hypothetical protein